MTPKLDDRWLCFSLGIFLFASFHTIRHCIKDTLHLTEISPTSDRTEYADSPQQPEDSISLSTLKTLALSPNHNIANSAISLIVMRFAMLPDAHEILAKDWYSKNEKLRRQARTALKFLQDYPSPDLRAGTGQHVPLDLSRGLGRGRGRVTDTHPHSFEDMVEYFRSSPDSEGGDDRNSMDLLDRLDAEMDDLRLNDGLVPSVERPIAGWTAIPRARPARSGEGEAESERRRRRREAMVLHEGDGGVEEDDIIRTRR
jgi:hypothetical protein